jgi:adenylate cyclase
LDKFIGDAVMAFFGAPYEQRDHARRAVEAAIAIHRKVAVWNRARVEERQPVLDLRIAINSGPVVVGDVGAARRVDYTVLGNTVNVAARLEQFVAGPGEIVVGPETRGQLGGAFEIEDLGDLTLKGLEEKVRGYRVVF